MSVHITVMKLERFVTMVFTVQQRVHTIESYFHTCVKAEDRQCNYSVNEYGQDFPQ